MSKTVNVKMPDNGRREAAVQAFVDQGKQEAPAPVKTPPRSTAEGQMVRLNLNMPQDLHRRLKTACAAQGVTIAEVVTQLVEGWTAEKR